MLARDRERLAQVKREHAEAARRYFAENAADWDTIRALHVAEDAVEAAMRRGARRRGASTACSISAPAPAGCSNCSRRSTRARVGIDASTDMLAVARANLDRAGIANAQVRLGDIYNLPFAAQLLRRRHHPPGAALSRRSGAGARRGGAGAAAGRTPAHRRFRAARPRVPARAPCPSPPRLRATTRCASGSRRRASRSTGAVDLAGGAAATS